MRRSLVLLALLAVLPTPASAACAGIADPAGDATLADDHVNGGAHDQPLPLPAFDIRSARVTATKAGTEFVIRLADLASLAAESPMGATWGWGATAADGRFVHASAYTTPTVSGVSVFTGRGTESKQIADYAAPVVDVATDTVRFTVPAKLLGWVRPGVRVTSVVNSRRFVGAHDGTRLVSQGLIADRAYDRARPWGRAGC